MSLPDPSTTVFLEPTGRRIQPFDDPIGETPILNRPLSWWQSRALDEAGLTRIEQPRPPCLVLPDTFLATGATLRAFIERAAGRDAVLVLARSSFGTATARVQPGVIEVEQGWRFEAIRFLSNQHVDPVDVVIDPQEQVVEFPTPRSYLGTETLSMGVPLMPVMTLHHWVHILWANQVMGGVLMRATPPWRWVLRVLCAVIRARSVNKWKVLAKLNRMGRGCDIHPTAVVEGCNLGDNVSVGPYARVLLSTLGDGVTIMPAAQIDLSVLGEGSAVSEQCVLRFSVVYPRAIVSQFLMQQCVLGRDVITTKGSVSIDLNFDQEIKVALDGKLHLTGLHFLGSAFGHRSRIGTGFFMACGRSVPNDYFLVRDPRTILSILPPGLAGQPAMASGSRLRALGLPGLGAPKRG